MSLSIIFAAFVWLLTYLELGCAMSSFPRMFRLRQKFEARKVADITQEVIEEVNGVTSGHECRLDMN